MNRRLPVRPLAVLLALSLAACAAPGPATPPPDVEEAAPANLEELLGDWTRRSGRSLTYTAELGQLLSSIEVRPIGPPGARVDLLHLPPTTPQR